MKSGRAVKRVSSREDFSPHYNFQYSIFFRLLHSTLLFQYSYLKWIFLPDVAAASTVSAFLPISLLWASCLFRWAFLHFVLFVLTSSLTGGEASHQVIITFCLNFYVV
jgi:hypothetical protein